MRNTHLRRPFEYARAIALTIVVVLSVSVVPYLAVAADSPDALVDSLLQQAGVNRGVCAVVTVGAPDQLSIRIARSSGHFVHVRCSDAESVER